MDACAVSASCYMCLFHVELFPGGCRGYHHLVVEKVSPSFCPSPHTSCMFSLPSSPLKPHHTPGVCAVMCMGHTQPYGCMTSGAETSLCGRLGAGYSYLTFLYPVGISDGFPVFRCDIYIGFSVTFPIDNVCTHLLQRAKEVGNVQCKI